MNADSLLVLLKNVMDGLHGQGIHVVSYACDGTEVERGVQSKFLSQFTLKSTYVIKNPHAGRLDTTITYGLFQGKAICMVQDSKHALKTLRNNLFSSARLLVLGNFTAMFPHVVLAAKGVGSPLFNRDVEKLDRQDDNAAVRLFSAEALKYFADNHPDFTGEIIYLFVFGELIDAYQNRHIPHAERLKLVLRARYFLDTWEAYLDQCGYQKQHYFISREATDIMRIIIEGFIALVIIHRDHVAGPLLPWLHSSEACEHVFGNARQIVKDFTFLDFIYMIPKLRIKLYESVLRGKSSNPKARAAGYNHTYFDNEGLDLQVLSHYPSDEEIATIAMEASEEADSLFIFLGVLPDDLTRTTENPHIIQLPSIAAWFDDDNGLESDEDSDEGGGDVDELHRILDEEENSPISRRAVIDETCMTLTGAALAIAAEEVSVV
jgi:hypothetical protein